MINFFKATLVVILFLVSLNADSIDSKIIEFEKNRFSKNKRIEIQKVSISTKKDLPIKSWSGYIINIEALMANRVVKAKDIVFSDGEIISSELFDLETGKSYKELMTPTLTSIYYDKAKFIAGNINAKDKLVIFSDPLCPFCIDFVPDVIKYVQKHEKNLALYYYHFPLTRIHPAAVPLSKLMILAKHKGIKDIEQKVYTIDWDKYFTSKETDVKKVLDGFNKEFKTSFSLKDLEDDKLEKELIYDINMGEEVMVDGTPTIFVNGEQDKTKLKYEQLGK